MATQAIRKPATVGNLIDRVDIHGLRCVSYAVPLKGRCYEVIDLPDFNGFGWRDIVHIGVKPYRVVRIIDGVIFGWAGGVSHSEQEGAGDD